jgi:hypothetical protein
MKKGKRTPEKLIEIIDQLDFKGIGPEDISRQLSKYISRRTVYRLLPKIREEREKRTTQRLTVTLPPPRPFGGVPFRTELDLLTRAVDPCSGGQIPIRKLLS